MTLKPHITPEEFDIIKKAISSALDLCQYDFIEASDGHGGAIAMSKEIFFKRLMREFEIE